MSETVTIRVPMVYSSWTHVSETPESWLADPDICRELASFDDFEEALVRCGRGKLSKDPGETEVKITKEEFKSFLIRRARPK